MATLKYGPKPRNLGEKEDLASLEVWKQNILYGLRLNDEFKPFLQPNFVWGKKSARKPSRNLEDVAAVKS